ncbi:MAG: hypothetical protein ACI4J8_07420 [Oscillospiraceae bacterium]
MNDINLIDKSAVEGFGMIDVEISKKIKELSLLYKQRWGKEPDYTIVPKGITQEVLLKVLERIVDTGESILVGWNKIDR